MSKYDTNVKPKLYAITEWARQGATEEDIAKKLCCIGYATFRDYKVKYKDLRDALRRGKYQPDTKVENSHFRCTQGYHEKVKKIIKLKTIEYDPDTGKKIRETETPQEVEETIYIPPNATLVLAWENNRMKENWKQKQQIDIDTGGQPVQVNFGVPRPEEGKHDG